MRRRSEIATTTTQNNWSGITATDNFSTTYTYDKNGIFDKLTRKNNGTAMDNFTNNYLNIGSAPSNRLEQQRILIQKSRNLSLKIISE